MEISLTMATFSRTNFSIGEVIRLWDKKQLILQPKFQRRRCWVEDARSYLIDTIVRGLPLPKIYLRLIVNPGTELEAYEVVDGQQRLAAIIAFRKGELVLSKRHNDDLGDTTFEDLPDPMQRAFLEYEISTEVMEDASDPEVWKLFERLNTYTLTLNRQEKLNAKWFGHFKQAAYQLAAEDTALNAWNQLGVFSNHQIARMKEVEMTSDILVAIVRGISDINEIARAYYDFDKEFPAKESAMAAFRATLSFVTKHLTGAIRITRFRRLSWFYSLMVATADSLVGIPKGNGPRDIESGEELYQRMVNIDEALKQEEPPPSLKDLYDTLSQATSHIRERQVRHTYFFNMLTLPKSNRRDWWAQLTAHE